MDHHHLLLSMIIVDPSDKTKFSDTITLGPDGKKSYELDLSGYASGVYTVVVTRGNAQTEGSFLSRIDYRFWTY